MVTLKGAGAFAVAMMAAVASVQSALAASTVLFCVSAVDLVRVEFIRGSPLVRLDELELRATDVRDGQTPGPFVTRLGDAILDYQLFPVDAGWLLRTTTIVLPDGRPTTTYGACRTITEQDLEPRLSTTITMDAATELPPINNLLDLLGQADALPVAILYEEGPLGELTPEVRATIEWRIVHDVSGAIIAATINIPDRRMTIHLSIQENHNTAFAFSHEIDFLVTIDPNYMHPAGGVDAIATLAVKTTEDAIGEPIVGRSQSLPPDFFWIELDPAAANQNINRLRSRDWFDLGIVYANGQRAILTFEKGLDGRQVFEEALAAWAAN